MATTLNRTMESAGCTHHSTNMNLSFAGFTNREIYCTSIWQIIPKSCSTTISVNPDCIMEVLYHISAMYGSPDDRGVKGLIFRSMDPSATVTLWTSTATISVQGTHHAEWVESILPEIELRMDPPKPAEPQSPTCNSSFDSDCDDTEIPIHPFPFTSTPRTSICISTAEPTVSTGTQSRTYCDAECQTNCVTKSTTGTQTELCPLTDVPCIQTPTSVEPCVLSSDHNVITTLVSDNNCSTAEPSIYVPNIPTNNPFTVLDVEETTSSSEADEPPIPLPWKISVSTAKSPMKPRITRPTSSYTRTSAPTRFENVGPTTPRSTPRPTPLQRTVLVIGDSIPKYLVGHKMSKRLKVLNKCIPGSNLEQWIKLAPALIQEECPTAVIIHCGTNNIASYQTTDCLSLYYSLVTLITSIQPRTRVIVSALTTQVNVGHAIWIREFNARLHELCKVAKWTFIPNENIDVSHLSRYDGLHLNRFGTILLAKNFISALQHLPNMDFHKDSHRTVK